MEHINISDFALRDTITGYYLISNISVKTSRTNEPYLDATLSDRTGSIEAKAWRYYGDLSENANGSVVKVKAEVAEYKGNLQLLIRDEKGSACIKKASAESDIFDIELLLPVAPIDADAEYNYILSIINSMQDEDYKALCSEMIRINEKSFRKIPAGKFVHQIGRAHV